MKKGLIVRTTGSWFTVEDENGELFDCKVKGNFRIKGIRSTNPVAVGDKVNFMVQNDTKISGKKNRMDLFDKGSKKLHHTPFSQSFKAIAYNCSKYRSGNSAGYYY